jgi:hypothetical protein
MRTKITCLILVGAALASISTKATAVTVETTNFISSPTYFNGFEGIGVPYYDGNIPYSEGGLTVQYIGTAVGGGAVSIGTGFTNGIGGQGNYGWYSGGAFGYTATTLTNGGNFQNVQFLIGVGILSSTIEYELLEGGKIVASGTSFNGDPMTYFGFSGGGFDTILVQDLWYCNSSCTFDPTGYDALAIDSIGATTPLPAALPLFATGLGALGLFGWRRKRKNAAAFATA